MDGFCWNKALYVDDYKQLKYNLSLSCIENLKKLKEFSKAKFGRTEVQNEVNQSSRNKTEEIYQSLEK